jgi:hypothetical protein
VVRIHPAVPATHHKQPLFRFRDPLPIRRAVQLPLYLNARLPPEGQATLANFA